MCGTKVPGLTRRTTHDPKADHDPTITAPDAAVVRGGDRQKPRSRLYDKSAAQRAESPERAEGVKDAEGTAKRLVLDA